MDRNCDKIGKNPLHQYDSAKNLPRTNDDFDFSPPKMKKGCISQKQRASEILESVMEWLDKNNVKEGNPDELRKQLTQNKKQDIVKLKSLPVQQSSLLSRRLNKKLTINA